MYHSRGRNDVTKFTDSCDSAHGHSEHLLRGQMSSGILFLSEARLLPVLPPQTGFSKS